MTCFVQLLGILYTNLTPHYIFQSYETKLYVLVLTIFFRATNKEDAKLQLEVALEEQKKSPFLVTIIQTKKARHIKF